MSRIPPNPYLTGRLGPIYARTALLIIFLMGMNGLLSVAVAELLLFGLTLIVLLRSAQSGSLRWGLIQSDMEKSA